MTCNRDLMSSVLISLWATYFCELRQRLASASQRDVAKVLVLAPLFIASRPALAAEGCGLRPIFRLLIDMTCGAIGLGDIIKAIPNRAKDYAVPR